MTTPKLLLLMPVLLFRIAGDPVAAPLAAQQKPLKNWCEIGGGAAMPLAGLSPYMSTSFLLRLAYGYRLHRNFQADVGLEAVFGAAGVNRSERSAVGDIRISDSELLVPFGARGILPLARDRLELHAGGGGAYLRYAEEASVPEGVNVVCISGPCYVDVKCPECRSRGGWGYYGTAGTAVSLDRRRRLWLGLGTRFVRATTSGGTLGSVPGFRTKDHWVNTAITLIYRW